MLKKAIKALQVIFPILYCFHSLFFIIFTLNEISTPIYHFVKDYFPFLHRRFYDEAGVAWLFFRCCAV